MFGWTAVQVHAKSVAKQLQMMFHTVRVLEGAFSLVRIDWKLETARGSGGCPVETAASVELVPVLEGAFSLLRIDWKLETAGGSGGCPVGTANEELMKR